VGKLKILAGGKSLQAQAQARGKLFEKLMADVLRHYGYAIDKIPNVNYAGMEIDIEGRAIVAQYPLYAECKCYDDEIDAKQLQAFMGKYAAKWARQPRCHGLFIALPGINTHAKGYYRENFEGNSPFSVTLYEEKQVLEAILDTPMISKPENIAKQIPEELGAAGEWVLLYTERGWFWVQYIIPLGSGIPSKVAFFESQGHLIIENATIDYLIQLWPELGDFSLATFRSSIPFPSKTVLKDPEEIVEVTGSSSYFEYQFPASPEFFVGRQSALQDLDSFTQAVIRKQTSSRGLLFEANSGWGKSSIVLSSVARLREQGHFAIAVDSRSASSSQFILRVVAYSLNKLADFNGLLPNERKPIAITGFDGAIQAILDIGHVLEQAGKLLFIFLDQFENVFFRQRQDALKRVTNLFLKVCDAKSNIVIGFSWKTDLIGMTNEFPYQEREAIRSASKRIALEPFGEEETKILLQRLSEEVHTSLRKELVFILSNFSQGYPWLLKKLCAHVQSQLKAGKPQSEMINGLLNIEELFLEDLRGLSSEEDDTLRRIAQAAPISHSELGEEFKLEVVRSLVDARLVVRIGSKYDVYWDIFRDYLNTGHLPAQENYILRLQVGSVVRAIRLLSEAGGEISIFGFQHQADTTEKTINNLIREMRLLGIAKVDGTKVRLQIALPPVEGEEFDQALRAYLKERLPHNRCVWQILNKLELSGEMLTLEEVADVLAKSAPYISATEETWQIYARILADWIDTADLAIFDRSGKVLKPMTKVRERSVLPIKRHGDESGIGTCIQYKPVEDAIIKVVEALQASKQVDWSGLKKSTAYKALASLEELGFITMSRRTQSIDVLPQGLEFVAAPSKRPLLFAEGALRIKEFANFIEILNKHQESGCSLSQLAIELRESLGINWTEGTALIHTKVMLDWARHTKLAPSIFAETRKGPMINRKRRNRGQLSLFGTNSAEEEAEEE
jgi:hypothetical protein